MPFCRQTSSTVSSPKPNGMPIRVSTPGRLGLAFISSAIFIDGTVNSNSAFLFMLRLRSLEPQGETYAMGRGADIEGVASVAVVVVLHPVEAALADDLERNTGGKGDAAQSHGYQAG